MAHYSAGLSASSKGGGGKKSSSSSNQHFRYLNGEKVFMKSGKDKFVVEEVGAPDWDGGSRGKVKTKGKRGPGFV
jgi:hypothetical protein